MKLSHRISQLPIRALIMALFLISSCSTTVLTPISDKDRDISGAYNGKWEVRQLQYKGVQTFGTDRFNCEMRARWHVLVVEDGRGTLDYRGEAYSGNINKEGKFRIEIPTTYEYKSSTGLTGQQPAITLIFQGSLADDKLSGMYIEGMAQLNNQGCSAPIKFQRI